MDIKRFCVSAIVICAGLLAYAATRANVVGEGLPTAQESKVVSTATAEWLDVTEVYVANPRFDNGSKEGWNIKSNAQSQNTGYGSMEFWHGDFNIHQTINVPNGKYRLTVQAYYRPTENDIAYDAYINDTETTAAYLYANEQQQEVNNIYSEHLSTAGAGRYYRVRDNFFTYKYFPDNMEAAAYCFTQDLYNDTIVFDVTDGMLTFGLQCDNYLSGNWCLFDNFKLEYYGIKKEVSSIKLSSTALILTNGESTKLTAVINPADATYQKVAWHSDNPQIADVDEHGIVTAYQNGAATIQVLTTDGSNVSASCLVTVIGSTPTAENIIINEIQSANIDMFVDPSFNYGGWVELYNPTDKAVSLNNLYISDDATNLTKYNLGRTRGAIPAKGYKLLWFDHCNNQFPSQIDFKLDYDGGTIYISDSEGNQITSQDYPVAIPRTSYARTTEGAEEWSFTAEPTPGTSNAKSTFAAERLMPPAVDHDACLFTTPFSVKVEIPKGATLCYTTDGATPTLTDGQISEDGVFDVTQTTTYRFRLFEVGKLPSSVVTRSYIYEDKDYMLPIISVVTDPVNLYDDSLGVYVKGVNGRTGNGQSSPCNWNMDWDRPVNFEYITPEEGMVVNQEVDFAMCGGWSRAWTPHSFKLKAAKIYEGINSINYPFFADKPYLKHKTLQIRNGGNDTNCRIKDAALQAIVHSSGLDVDGQSTQPVMHFINGEYKGMLNMREPNNKHYAYANWGIDTDEMDQFEMSPDSGYVQMEGDKEAFLKWYELSANASDEACYEAIRNIVDIDEYINYMAVEFYLGGMDWPQNNIKGFRPRIENGRFRFVLFDLDGTLSTTTPFYTFENKQEYTFDYIYDMNGRFTEEIEWVTIFLNMLSNDTFRKQFVDTYCLVAGSVFEPNRCSAIIDKMAEHIAPALALEGRSPYGTANNMKGALASRLEKMISALVNYERMQITQEQQSVSIESNVDNSVLRLNDMLIPTGKFNGIVFSPITLKAEPKAGYRFAGWSTPKASDQGTTLIARGSSWNYYDQGSLDGTTWNARSYATTTWKQGNAPLGYFTNDDSNSRGYKTLLDYGTDANDKRPTYYFRNTFRISQTPTSNDQFVLNYTVDDGMIVYINGTEVTRYLMPSGTITYDTYATTYANSNPDKGSIVLDASIFKRGINSIAVEIHNCDNKSSDIYFDAELIQTSIQNIIVCEEEEYTLPSTGDLTLTALYEPLTDAELETSNHLPIRINEISADNNIYINDYYKKNDWIELYNTTSEAIDVAGMYLSDNLKKPTKYQITASNDVNTIIAPYGHLIIWADKLISLNQLHASFKLAAEGGIVMLTSTDKRWSDILYYEPHLGTESTGLYPDGSNNVYVMTKPTIASPNAINSYATWIEQPAIDTDIESAYTDEQHLHLTHQNHQLHIYSSESTWADVTIYATTGRVCARATVSIANGYATYDTRFLSQGIYILTITDSNGETQTIKLSLK